MTNLIRKLFKGDNQGCCNVKIEEVMSEPQAKELSDAEKASRASSCCRTETNSENNVKVINNNKCC